MSIEEKIKLIRNKIEEKYKIKTELIYDKRDNDYLIVIEDHDLYFNKDFREFSINLLINYDQEDKIAVVCIPSYFIGMAKKSKSAKEIKLV